MGGLVSFGRTYMGAPWCERDLARALRGQEFRGEFTLLLKEALTPLLFLCGNREFARTRRPRRVEAASFRTPEEFAGLGIDHREYVIVMR